MIAAAATFAGRLRALRESAGLTQGALAGRAGWTQGRLAQLEAGGARPRKETVVRLAGALGVGPSALDPEFAAEVPPGAVVLCPDPDTIGAYRPWRPEDGGRLADLGWSSPVAAARLAELAEAVGRAGRPLCLLP